MNGGFCGILNIAVAGGLSYNLATSQMSGAFWAAVASANLAIGVVFVVEAILDRHQERSR
jgi:hypothetical protein